MQDYCSVCIDCKEAWSASMSESCHTYCEDFKRWKEGLTYRGHLETESDNDTRAIS